MTRRTALIGGLHLLDRTQGVVMVEPDGIRGKGEHVLQRQRAVRLRLDAEPHGCGADK